MKINVLINGSDDIGPYVAEVPAHSADAITTRLRRPQAFHTRHTTVFSSDCVYLCVRIPKSGSVSMASAVTSAFSGHRIFYLPHTLELDGRLSRFQHFRYVRTQRRNLNAAYGTRKLDDAFAAIRSTIRGGDLIGGGHIDFASVSYALDRPVKIITLLRNPYQRSLSEYRYARNNHLRKPRLARFDSHAVAMVAAKHDFEGYLDFLTEHRDIYGDLASRYLGFDGVDPAGYFQRNVFHAGILEMANEFSRGLAAKTGRPVGFPHLNKTDAATHAELSHNARQKIARLYERDFIAFEYLRDTILAERQQERIPEPAYQ
jgi:hypothetical protein